jgi:hypothetical protein
MTTVLLVNPFIIKKKASIIFYILAIRNECSIFKKKKLSRGC